MRYYPCHRKVKNPYIFSKVRFQYCEKNENQTEWREPIVTFEKKEKLKIDNLFQDFRNKKEIKYRPIVCW